MKGYKEEQDFPRKIWTTIVCIFMALVLFCIEDWKISNGEGVDGINRQR
jgi:hypothetical protein